VVLPVGTAESERLRPLQHDQSTAQEPTRRSTKVAKVNQKPGPVFVVTPPTLLNSNLMRAKSAISMANAIRVKSAAKNATNEATMPMIGPPKNSAKTNAKNVAMVETG